MIISVAILILFALFFGGCSLFFLANIGWDGVQSLGILGLPVPGGLIIAGLFVWWAYRFAVGSLQLPKDTRHIAINTEASDLSADILKKLPDGAVSTKIGASFEYQGETVRVVEAGYVVGGTVFLTIEGAIARIEKTA